MIWVATTSRYWTTFLKARLNCSLPGEYPFYYDYIQSVTYLEEERLFYATFTTAEYVTFCVSIVCNIFLKLPALLRIRLLDRWFAPSRWIL